jgi:hypothetical protein
MKSCQYVPLRTEVTTSHAPHKDLLAFLCTPQRKKFRVKAVGRNDKTLYIQSTFSITLVTFEMIK